MAKYSKAYLKSLDSQEKWGSDEHTKVFDELHQMATNKEKLSMAETMSLCSWMEVNHSIKSGPESFEFCTDYVFRKLYLTYFNNLDGVKEVRGPVRGQTTLQKYSPEKKQRDVEKLQSIHDEWLPNIQKFNHKGNQLLNLVASEANKELKDVHKLFREGHFGRNALTAKEQAISLQSKYIYITAKSFFEEQNGSVVSNLFGESISIDEDTMIHIMFRHYAGATKQYDTGKSYHMDRSINLFELPNEIKEILDAIAIDKSNKITDPQEFLPIELNSKLYSFWIKQKGGVLKVTTFYPVSEEREIERIKNDYTKEKINDNLSVFVKKNVSD